MMCICAWNRQGRPLRECDRVRPELACRRTGPAWAQLSLRSIACALRADSSTGWMITRLLRRLPTHVRPTLSVAVVLVPAHMPRFRAAGVRPDHRVGAAGLLGGALGLELVGAGRGGAWLGGGGPWCGLWRRVRWSGGRCPLPLERVGLGCPRGLGHRSGRANEQGRNCQRCCECAHVVLRGAMRKQRSYAGDHRPSTALQQAAASRTGCAAVGGTAGLLRTRFRSHAARSEPPSGLRLAGTTGSAFVILHRSEQRAHSDRQTTVFAQKGRPSKYTRRDNHIPGQDLRRRSPRRIRQAPIDSDKCLPPPLRLPAPRPFPVQEKTPYLALQKLDGPDQGM